ncbi:hypothetical protein Taro_050682 [Colocasia esculenta]|uniref:RNase H type-1 domain-containing protein n=1 Tax=Colocasia esculenta TaxID=4460 RepID=A0A843XEE9_COLES|nr:hypothetical protein [Colocasia esculenta]
MMAASFVIPSNTRWFLGNGDSIKFLDDVWFGEKPLRETVSYELQESSPSVKEVACSTFVIRHHIHYLVNVALDNLVFKDSATAQQMEMIKDFGFSYLPRVKMVKMVRWIPPLHGPLLNVDGASKGNPGPCGGGGIVRSTAGTVLFAFSHFYGAGTSLLAECRAMCDRVLMALEKGVHLPQISTDSLVLDGLQLLEMEQDLEEPLLPPKAILGVVWAWFPLGYEDHGVSTHRQTVSIALATASELASGTDSECRHHFRLCRHHWQTVSTHRQTVSTPLATFLHPVH